ncbi:hypothetical protein PRZ48_002012 [Zasmidium cellare]|uniref:ferric-chelate reductase (NADPH) n=1 Tax=Zasmidium cellare TaxID=395010 RepID=A0ABR0F3W0_ZASCE|nr:hypothetical protein PRZ48_002012 [Zasmidium cellare]
MYHFVDLTHEQKLLRREYLDFYGFLGQISVVVPILAIQGYLLVAWIQRKVQREQDLQTPSSPYVKQARLGYGWNVSGLAARWSIFAWWCGDTVEVAGVYLGTKGEVIVAGVWTLWLVVLCFLQTGDDYLHMTKRFGIVASSQLPFHYLLSLKTPYSPLQLLTRQSHESLISIHQLLGRIITVLLYGHAALYLNFYILSGLLGAKLQEFYVLCGIFGIVAFTIIGTTALKPVRDWSYRVFYIVHVVLATALLPVLYFHVSHIRIYLYETILIYAANAALRFFATNTQTATITQAQGTNLLDITIPINKASNKSKFQPGQHAYISLSGHPLLRTFRSNPFTAASIPSIDGQLRFVARILDGNTAKLAQSKSFSPKLSIEGPYGLSSHADKLLQYDRVLFVAGGVGVTFIVPLYRQLLNDLSPGKGSYRRQKVNFLWVARSMADVEWALPAYEQEREGFAERLRVYITKNTDGIASSSSNGDFTIGEDEEQIGEEGIELEDQKKPLMESGPGEKSDSGLAVSAGRPDLTRVVEQVFSQSSSERVAVLVCGPRGLSKVVRRDVGRWVKRGREVWFHNEEFAL